MRTFHLYNLYMGDTMPSAPLAKFTIGPFCVELTPDYEENVRLISQYESKTIAFDPMTETKMINFNERRRGNWLVTATANYDESETGFPSILSHEPINDYGIWDLCVLLTFLTGRRVAFDAILERYDPDEYGTNACHPFETLRAASIAWNQRQAVVDQKVTYAILMHTEALTQNMLQISGALNNTALNILSDKCSIEKSSLSADAKQELLKKVMEAVDACSGLSPENRNSFKNLLGSKVNQGLGSMADRTKALLIELEIVDPEPDDKVMTRILFLNTIRNKLTHSGKVPLLSGLDKRQSMRYASAIVKGIVPQITIMALGKLFGFKSDGLGSLSQNPSDLRRFFNDGMWRDWPIEIIEFEDWFYADLNEE